MMTTLNSSLLNLDNSKAVRTTVLSQQHPAAEQTKRFAQIMAKAQAAAPQAPLANTSTNTNTNTNANAAALKNAAHSAPGDEASRAEANARDNVKTAARALATRALVKAPASGVNPITEPHAEPHIEPHIAASDGAPLDANEADDETDANSAVLSADMAAWVAALNRSSMPSASAAKAQHGGDTAVTDSELSTQGASHAAGQVVADRNTQIFRQAADPDDDGHAQRGGAGHRAAQEFARSGVGSDSAGASGRDSQQPGSRAASDGVEARAAAYAPTLVQTDALNAALTGNAMTVLSKEGPSTAASTASNAADFSALMSSGSINAKPAGSSSASTLTLSLPIPVNAPEFREALGVQVSLLARDGVHTAQLHLNPADMGPVSIQIAMDGTLARVDFGADMAATRTAIEASMPELASALLDAGFTLAGGGVSQHAKGQTQPDAESRAGATRRTITVTTAHVASEADQPTQRRVEHVAGGVDLFA